jgi:hypothetical protein
LAAIALVETNAADLDAGRALKIGDDGLERVAVARIAMQPLDMKRELAAFWPGHRRNNKHVKPDRFKRSENGRDSNQKIPARAAATCSTRHFDMRVAKQRL